MKISMKTAVASTVAALLIAPVVAQEGESPAEGGEAAAVAAAPAKDAKVFFALMRCLIAEGDVQVLKPRAKEWVKAEEGRYYPLGSSVRALVPEGAPQPNVVFAFGPEAKLSINAAAEFSTEELEDLGAATRTVILRSGRVSLDLPRALKDGLFFVRAPFFECSNLAGESQFDYSAAADGDEAVVRCVTGSMALKGSHYSIARMSAANQVRIRSTGDNLFTSLRGESGDCKVLLDQGMGTEKNFETGEVKDVHKTLEFALSPLCAIKIFRAKVSVGGNTVVSIMTFDPSGEMKNRCAFAEGRSNVNSGELVIAKVAEAGKDSKAKSAEAEATEVVEAKPEESEEKEEKKDEKKEEDSDI